MPARHPAAAGEPGAITAASAAAPAASRTGTVTSQTTSPTPASAAAARSSGPSRGGSAGPFSPLARLARPSASSIHPKAKIGPPGTAATADSTAPNASVPPIARLVATAARPVFAANLGRVGFLTTSSNTTGGSAARAGTAGLDEDGTGGVRRYLAKIRGVPAKSPGTPRVTCR